jgi:hypothetical protein
MRACLCIWSISDSCRGYRSRRLNGPRRVTSACRESKAMMWHDPRPSEPDFHQGEMQVWASYARYAEVEKWTKGGCHSISDKDRQKQSRDGGRDPGHLKLANRNPHARSRLGAPWAVLSDYAKHLYCRGPGKPAHSCHLRLVMGCPTCMYAATSATPHASWPQGCLRT